MENVYRCDHCNQTKPLSELLTTKGQDKKEILSAFCSVKCHLAVELLVEEEVCLRTHGGIHPSTVQSFWFRDPDGVDHYRVKCGECKSECKEDGTPLVPRCPTSHRSLIESTHSWAGPRQAIDPCDPIVCPDCGQILLFGLLGALSLAS